MIVYTTRKYIEAFCSTLVSEGIEIKEGKDWHTDLKNKTMTYNVSDLLSMSIEDSRGLVLHEAGHLMFSSTPYKSELTKKYPAWHNAHNAVEDNRMEHQLCKKYGDFGASSLAWTNESILLNNLSTPKLPEGLGGDAKTFLDIMFLISVHGMYSIPGEQHYFEYSEYAMTKNVGFKAKEFYQKHKKVLHDISQDCITSKTIGDLVKILDTRLFPLLKDLLDKIPPEEQKKMAGQGQQGDKEGEGEGEEMMVESRGGGTMVSAPKEHKNLNEDNISLSDSDIERIYSLQIHTLAAKLEGILKERKSTRYTGLHDGGRLLSKNTYRVMTDEHKIFSKRTVPNKTDYNIIFVLDQSGSMRGDKHDLSYIGGYMLDQVFKRLHFDTEYILFNQHVKQEDSFKPYRVFWSGDNNDEEALDKAIENVNPKKENIVLMIGDGAICTDIDRPMDKLKRMGVTVIGVGVGLMKGHNDLEEHYPICISVPNVEQLPNELISLMKRIIHR
jgi:hypothetical protein